MRIKLSDYIAKFLVDNDIEHVFTVTGGGAMHLNDSLGHNQGLTCIYNHHEQASAMAAQQKDIPDIPESCQQYVLQAALVALMQLQVC